MKKIKVLLLLFPHFMLLVGTLGALHPVFNSVSVFREFFLALVIISGVSFLFMKRYSLVVLCLFFCIFFSKSLWPVKTYNDFTHSIYQKNVLFKNKNLQPLVEDIISRNVQFVALQEVTTKHLSQLNILKNTYPSFYYCKYASVGGVVVASKYKVIENTQGCVYKEGVAYMQLETEKGSVWLISVHLHWPWPFDQPRQLKRIVENLAHLKGEKIIAGDFNMVPWSQTLNNFAKQTNTEIIKGTNRTFSLFNILNIPIDHVFLTKPDKKLASKETGELLGSDHKGVIATFSL